MLCLGILRILALLSRYYIIVLLVCVMMCPFSALHVMVCSICHVGIVIKVVYILFIFYLAIEIMLHLYICRSPWENHCVPKCPLWFVLLARDSNCRHGGRRSNLEGVCPHYILHLQRESHKCWFGCGWHKCLYGISGGGFYIWVHLQTGQWTV